MITSAMRFETIRRHFALSLTAAIVGLHSLLLAETEPAAEGEQNTQDEVEPELPALRIELLARFKKDQDVRKKMIESQKKRGLVFGSPEFLQQAARFAEVMKAIDAENLAWFKQIVEKHGWPGRSLVGQDGAGAAYILAQHADQDRPFQKRCLELMQRAPAGEVRPQNIAYLTDRVLLAEDKPQRYGSQVEFVDGRWRLRPVEDPERLDERRQAVGLPPIAEYLRMIAEVYGKQKATPSAQ